MIPPPGDGIGGGGIQFPGETEKEWPVTIYSEVLDDTRIGPFWETHWSQETPYNNNCGGYWAGLAYFKPANIEGYTFDWDLIMETVPTGVGDEEVTISASSAET